MSLHLEQVHWMSSPPLVPDEPPIDLQHLKRMTMGEPALEREVLTLFATQSRELASKLAGMPDDADALAHTLKGSARAVGAFRVAEAALNLEAAMRDNHDVVFALKAVSEAVDEAATAIDAMLRRP
jgi:HPt (histidine-containing phosphotransfer) domain-containing protein